MKFYQRLIGFILSWPALVFAAGNEFSNIDEVVKNFGTSTQTNVGTLGRMIFAFLPLVLMLAVALLTYKFQKEKADRDDGNKLAIATGLSAIGGAFLGILVNALLGMLLLQDPAAGLTVMSEYWRTALGI